MKTNKRLILKTKKKLLVIIVLILCAGCSSPSGDEYYAIDHFCFKEEGKEFEEAFAKTTVDVYNWYKSIEGEDGVYILHSDHYTEDLLDSWRAHKIYDNVPEKGFWYFAVSENYLRDRGYALSEEDSEWIHSGGRLYLLPGSMPEEELEVMKEYLKEEALYGLTGDPMIRTVFELDPKIEYRIYSFDGTLETEEDGEINDPVIFVCSSENMKFFESESLIATGKRDSYIKLTKDAYERFIKNGFPEEFKERKITFLPLSKIKN